MRIRRTTILDPATDGPVLPANAVLQLHLTSAELHDSLENEEAAIKWLAKHSLLANSMACPGAGLVPCGSLMSLVKVGRNKMDSYIWRCADCRANNSIVKKSIRSNSFFSKAHLSFQKVMMMIYMWASHPSASRAQIATQTGVQDHKTITDYEWCLDHANPVMLGGPGTVVEIDESKLYKAKYNRGRGLFRTHKWVFGILERGTRRVVVVPVVRRDAATLLPIISQWIRPGTTIVSDSWKAYGGIQHMAQGYQHLQVNHRQHFVNPNNRVAHTQGIESNWSTLKRSLQHLRGTSDALFESYLYQFMFLRALQPNDSAFGSILFWIAHYNPV